MKIRLVVTDVNAHPTDRPRGCRYCQGAILHRHGTLKKPIKDHPSTEVHRYKCLSCERTFHHYSVGVSRKDQSRRTVVLAALMYALRPDSQASYGGLEDEDAHPAVVVERLGQDKPTPGAS
jgi:hypothetical protein